MAALFSVSVASVEVNESPCVCVSSSRLRRGQMKEASEMKYGDQVEGERSHTVDSHGCLFF